VTGFVGARKVPRVPNQCPASPWAAPVDAVAAAVVRWWTIHAAVAFLERGGRYICVHHKIFGGSIHYSKCVCVYGGKGLS